LAFGYPSLGGAVEALVDSGLGAAHNGLLHNQDHLAVAVCTFDVYLDVYRMEHSWEMEIEALP
jgi:hypothetical protein